MAESSQKWSLSEKMKYEVNRYRSFREWPIKDFRTKSLSEAGFFYLHQADTVQCAFCRIIIHDWEPKSSPLKIHLQTSPNCPFMMGHDVGNVPMVSYDEIDNQQENQIVKNGTEKLEMLPTHFLYKPRHPTMSNVHRRLLSYTHPNWKSNMSSLKLADCGLYYSEVADCTICYFCGGILGNWKFHDDPWELHRNLFPDCGMLSLPKRKSVLSGITDKCLEEAFHIFPKPVVIDAVERNDGKLISLQELCNDILEHQVATTVAEQKSYTNVVGHFTCTVCMDKVREVVFQPCGHFVSCSRCAKLVSTCPVCRKTIVNIIQTYIS